MGQAVNTLGMRLMYAVETVAGERPTSGYTNIPDVKASPDFGSDPDQLETTTYANEKNHSYIPGLLNYETFSFDANYTEELETVWDDVMSDYEQAEKDGKAMWFVLVNKKLKKALYWPGIPTQVYWGAASFNEVLPSAIHITVTGDLQKEAKPTETPTVE